mmetsp:Transcript_33663/g.77672  ORF Transcript_33663/g.77672 Transcript_33663/m.77672 type:complete len:535 (-) Transcript_33663:61-1665(-)
MILKLFLAVLLLGDVMGNGVRMRRTQSLESRKKKKSAKGFEVLCPRTLANFRSFVFVVVRTGYGIPSDDLREIESVFGSAYNGVIEGMYCDQPHFRVVEKVEAVVYEDLGDNAVRLLLVVDGLCRDCDSNTTRLFSTNSSSPSEGDAVPSGRMLMSGGKGRKKKVDEKKVSSCVCSTLNIGHPTESDVSPVFKSMMDVLIGERRLRGVVDFLGLSEVTPVDCGAEMTTFNSAVSTSFTANVDEVNDIAASERALLRDGFRFVFNDLQSTYCDPQFKQVVSVEQVSRTVRKLGESDRNLQQLSFFLVFEYLVRGVCRGCSLDSNLFDDGLKRKLSTTPMEETPSQELCFCALRPTAARAPTDAEFRIAFDAWAIDERQEGNLQSILRVDEVIQIDEDRPSSSPSASPSRSPSSIPSSAPSSSPSSTPSTSVAPSSTPSTSVAPSSTPSASLSSTPSTSTAPSSIPSLSTAPSSTPSMSAAPSSAPSISVAPSTSGAPSSHPTASPTMSPTESPRPSPTPSVFPSNHPQTVAPTDN